MGFLGAKGAYELRIQGDVLTVTCTSNGQEWTYPRQKARALVTATILLGTLTSGRAVKILQPDGSKKTLQIDGITGSPIQFEAFKAWLAGGPGDAVAAEQHRVEKIQAKLTDSAENPKHPLNGALNAARVQGVLTLIAVFFWANNTRERVPLMVGIAFIVVAIIAMTYKKSWGALVAATVCALSVLESIIMLVTAPNVPRTMLVVRIVVQALFLLCYITGFAATSKVQKDGSAA